VKDKLQRSCDLLEARSFNVSIFNAFNESDIQCAIVYTVLTVHESRYSSWCVLLRLG
jgi:hypothetical protein